MTWVTTEAHSQLHCKCDAHTSVTLWVWHSLTVMHQVWGSLIFMCELTPWGPLTVILCTLVRLTYIYIMNVSTQNYPTGVRLTIMLRLWDSFTVKLHVWGSLTFTLSVWAHSYLIYHCETHSQLCYRCEAHSHYIIHVTWITTVWLNCSNGWMAHSHLQYKCDAHSWVTTVRLTHNYTMSVRLTHSYVVMLHYMCKSYIYREPNS